MIHKWRTAGRTLSFGHYDAAGLWEPYYVEKYPRSRDAQAALATRMCWLDDKWQILYERLTYRRAELYEVFAATLESSQEALQLAENLAPWFDERLKKERARGANYFRLSQST